MAEANQGAILRRPRVEALTGLSRSSLYDLIRQGRFPAPVQLTEKSVGWREAEVLAWIESRPSTRPTPPPKAA